MTPKLPEDLIKNIRRYTPYGSREAHILQGLVKNRPGNHGEKVDKKRALYKDGLFSTSAGFTPKEDLMYQIRLKHREGKSIKIKK